MHTLRKLESMLLILSLRRRRSWGRATAAGGQEDRGFVSMHDRKPEKGAMPTSAKSLSLSGYAWLPPG